MRSLLSITAIFEGLTGLALAISPALVASKLLGTPLSDPSALLIARLAGFALITLAIACWLSRKADASLVMVKAMTVYNTSALSLLVYSALVPGISGQGLWPAVVAHLVLLVWCVLSLLKRVR